MPLRFALPRPDGGTSIVIAAPKAHLERLFGPLTDEQYRAHVLQRNRLTEAGVVELSEDWESPEAGIKPFPGKIRPPYRDAWKLNGKSVEVDMDKAREIHMNHIRKARAAKLPALDVQFTRAQGRKDQAAADAVEVERQRLRDLPSTFDLSGAKTPAELKALWPPELA